VVTPIQFAADALWDAVCREVGWGKATQRPAESNAASIAVGEAVADY